MTNTQNFEEAYRNYIQALQEAWAPSDVQKRLVEAYSNYMQVLQESRTLEDSQKHIEAYYNYLRVQQEAWAPCQVQKRFKEAYNNYLLALKRAWAQVDVNTIDAATMADLSRNMMAVAFYTNGIQTYTPR